MTANHPKKLFLLDAMALVYRAYFAFNSSKNAAAPGGGKLVNSKGLNTSTVYGFVNTLLDVINKEKPTHICVVFDTAAPTTRHEEFTAYKAQREEMPEELSLAIPYVKQVVEAFRIPVIGIDGFEADDVIGTLAKRAEQEGFITYMMTPDKDYGQLVTEKVFIYKPARMGNGAEVLGVKEVCAKFEVENPLQVIDILGLWGDASDNIPGIAGVGEKTAKEFIKTYGSVENLLANTADLKGKMKEKVELGAEMAILSKKLATIITDVPVDITFEAMEYIGPDAEQIRPLFAELEFRTLTQKVLGENLQSLNQAEVKPVQGGLFDTDTSEGIETVSSNNPTPFDTIENTPHEYVLVDTPEKRKALLAELLAADNVCFDSETTSLESLDAEIVGLSFSITPGKAYYVPVPEVDGKAVVAEFAPLFANEKVGKTGQNMKYDIAVLANYGIEVKGPLFDTMLAHYLLNPDMRHNMNILAETYLNYQPIKIETLIGKKGASQGTMRNVEVDKLVDYAAEDADITLKLRHIFEPQLTETATRKLFDEIEMPLMPVLADMEREGINLDIEALKDISAGLQADIDLYEKEIYELADLKFNINSPKQLGEVLFLKLKIDANAKRTGATKQFSTAEEVLAKLTDKHPIVQKVLDYRSVQKLKSTYADSLPTLINPATGRIHTSYNQAVAATGRLSSNNPNLQNIPIRTEKGREIRKAFVPRNEEYTILSADYSQVELRIIAHLSQDPGMLEAFNHNYDIHAATAARVYGVDLADVTSTQRRNAKMVNFGIIYGISAFGLSQRLNIPRGEAAEIISNYFAQYGRVKEYMDESIAFARQNGYVETIMGRRRYLRDITSGNAAVRGFAERNAINAPIQGSAADIIKLAMINLDREFKALGVRSKMLLQVHDELVFDLHKTELEQLKPIIKNHMSNAVSLTVPLEVEIGTGINWLEAH